jgi:glycosyltransferase involved in cell wall biosynthesis
MHFKLDKSYFYCGQVISFELPRGIIQRAGTSIYSFTLPYISEDGHIAVNVSNDSIQWFESLKNVDTTEYLISNRVKILPNFTIFRWWDSFDKKIKISKTGIDIDYNKFNESDLSLYTSISEKSLERFMINKWRDKHKSRRKKIFIDLSSFFITRNKMEFGGGIQRVTDKISKYIFLNKDEYEIIPVYANEKFGYLRAIRYESSVKNIVISEEYLNPISFSEGDIFFGLSSEFMAIPLMREYLEEMSSSGVKILFFLHDIIPIKNKEWFLYEIYDSYNKWIKEVIKYDGVICNSKYTLNSFKEWIHQSKFEIRKDFTFEYTHLGTDFSDKPKDKRPKKDELNFLMIGTVEPRKGYSETLKVFSNIIKEHNNVKLNIVGKYGWLMNDFMFELNENQYFNKNIFWYKDLDDKKLEEMIYETDCLISASYDEGFGIPTIECAQKGIPLILRDIEIYREIFKEDEAIFFQNLEQSILKWIKLFESNEHPLCERKFNNWKEVSDKIYEILLKIK